MSSKQHQTTHQQATNKQIYYVKCFDSFPPEVARLWFKHPLNDFIAFTAYLLFRCIVTESRQDRKDREVEKSGQLENAAMLYMSWKQDVGGERRRVSGVQRLFALRAHLQFLCWTFVNHVPNLQRWSWAARDIDLGASWWETTLHLEGGIPFWKSSESQRGWWRNPETDRRFDGTCLTKFVYK